MKTYDIIYSIGCDCACSMYLKRNGLRIASGPLDWLTNATFEERAPFILNNFEDFLNPSDFQFLHKNPLIKNDELCDYYKNTRTNLYFYHDFPIGVPFNDSFPIVEKKYKRRIDRFYKNMTSKNKILLVWFSHYHTIPDNSLTDFCESFCRKMSKRIDLLIIEHSPQKSEIIKINDNITRIKLDTVILDENGNPTTLGNTKSCDAIFSQYKIRTSFISYISHLFLKALIKIMCIFIPFKKWRKIIRKKLLL